MNSPGTFFFSVSLVLPVGFCKPWSPFPSPALPCTVSSR